MKAALYCRLSEEDRSKREPDSVSIQNQKALLLQYAEAQGWEIFGIYSDDDYTGADRNRPAFRRLLRDAEEHCFDIVLCKTQSRFTREMELVETYLHGLFPRWGIRFVSIVDSADTANRGNKKSRQINGLVNEWYLEDMSENIRSVLDNRRQNGFHIGSFALYGYRKDPEHRGQLLVDEEAAAVVRSVFTRYAQGMGKAAIARALNESGIPNPTEYKRRQGLRYRQAAENSTLWSDSAISSMLRNEMYRGWMVQGRCGSISYKTKENRPRPRSEWFIVPDTHEPIIDDELWARVQALLAERSRPFSGGTVGLFAGKVRCAACGALMRSTRSHGRTYLQCPRRRLSRDACPGAFVSVQFLEEVVRNRLRELTVLLTDRESLLNAVQTQIALPRPEPEQSVLREAEKHLASLHRQFRRLYADRCGGILEETEFQELSASLRVEKSEAEKRLTVCRKKLDARRKAPPKDQAAEAAGILSLDALDRTTVLTFLDHIAVGRRQPGMGTPPLMIFWTF